MRFEIADFGQPWWFGIVTLVPTYEKEYVKVDYVVPAILHSWEEVPAIQNKFGRQSEVWASALDFLKASV